MKHSLQFRLEPNRDATRLDIIRYDLKAKKRWVAKLTWEEMPDSDLLDPTLLIDMETDEVLNMHLLEKISEKL